MGSLTIPEAQRKFFLEGRTRDIRYRREALARLGNTLRGSENTVREALHTDLGKPAFESWGSEIGPAIREISLARRKLAEWAKPRRVSTPLLMFPGTSHIRPEPYGVALLLAPWNYPVHLSLIPLASAIAAGNCAVLKPSEFAPASARVLASLIGQAFDPGHATVVEGDAEAASALLRDKWDYILFSGSTAVGHLVMNAAAKNLTPLTLELGGKCPAIVEADADIAVAARRIAWGKFYNAGQTCVAPDYAMVAAEIMGPFVAALRKSAAEFFGPDASASPDYARIVNERHFARLTGLLAGGRILFGGGTKAEARYIEPTALGDVPPNGALMNEEIFGPLLPVFSYSGLDEAIARANSRPSPLTLYFFSTDKMKAEKVIREVRSGGAVINDVITHLANPALPFGGIGASGFGRYHGRHGFDTFSQLRGILQRPFHPDFSFRYPPYRLPLNWLKKLF